MEVLSSDAKYPIMDKFQHDRETDRLHFGHTACDCMDLLCTPLLSKKTRKIDADRDDLSADDTKYSEDEDDYPDGDTEVEREGAENQPDAINQSQSETFSRQYVSTDKFRIVVGTWNVAGRKPPPHLKLHDWLELSDPADIYVLGFQEIVALDAWNAFCVEDRAPAMKWQDIIHEALNKVDQNDFNIFGRIATNAKRNSHEVVKGADQIDLRSVTTKPEVSDLAKDSGPAKDGVLLAPLLSPISRSSSIKSPVRKPVRYVCVASKRMVGIYITVWVRRKLQRFIHSLKVCHVGLGLMGCLGNKGSISVSMILSQTRFCFICSHLRSGDAEGDKTRRNADVKRTLKRTCFSPTNAVDGEVPNTILGHDCVIWLGDLNYRLNLSDSEIRFLVSREDWPALLGEDQLREEVLQGGVFEGWHEGTISFAPTYKYDINSCHYAGESRKRREKTRAPAWCDRILWYGKGLKQLSYMRQESTLSDHKPVNAVFLAEVEVFHGCNV